MTTTIKNYKQICKKVKLICTDFIGDHMSYHDIVLSPQNTE